MHIDLNYLASSTRSEICPVSYVMIFVYKQVTASMSTMSYAPYQVYIAQETLRINVTLIFDTVFYILTICKQFFSMYRSNNFCFSLLDKDFSTNYALVSDSRRII